MNPKPIINFIRELYQSNEFIPLHAPIFKGNEKKYVLQTIDSTFVSSVGKYVDQFEKEIELYTGSSKAIATSNGTAALHSALHASGVQKDDLVITQALTFVATGNVIHHMGASPIFLDVSKKSLGLCPIAVSNYLHEFASIDQEGSFHKKTGQRIKAIVPMHTFGHPVELDELVTICDEWKLVLIEDAAESVGSTYKGQHTGTLGDYGALSFNGNKIITTGGGGAVLCKNKKMGDRVKHLTTTAKVPHKYEFFHDEPGFNYRMPNINAALGCAQLEGLETYIYKKRKVAEIYEQFFLDTDVKFFKEPDYAKSNYWLNSIICPNKKFRNNLLDKTNAEGVMTRPIWTLLHRLPMFKDAIRDDLSASKEIEACLVNLPSSPINI